MDFPAPFIHHGDGGRYLGTRPTDWPREHIPSRMSFEVNYPEEIKKKVLGNWHKKYGFNYQLYQEKEGKEDD